MGEIRWLNEAKTPLEEVNDEEAKIGNSIEKAIYKYKGAKNIQQKDNAVAEVLDSVTGTKAGSTLKNSLGIGMLSRFMDAFKWDSLTQDNLFIRLLQRLFGGYKDAEVITKILSGQKPTAERDMETKVDQSNINKNITQETTESLNEATLSPEAAAKLNNEISANRRAKKSNNANKDSISAPEKNNFKVVSKYNINNDEAKILDMSPKDLFLVLYNEYILLKLAYRLIIADTTIVDVIISSANMNPFLFFFISITYSLLFL